MKKLILLIALCLIVGVVSAQHDVFHKNGAKSDINVTSDDAGVSYTNTVNGVAFSHFLYIDGSQMVVSYNSQNANREIWGTGNGIGNSDVLVQHDFDGSVNDTLKGTITIKTPHAITYPYTLQYGVSIYPFQDGFKVTKGTDQYSEGIIIQPPTATNNTGGVVPVWYTHDSSKITLNINDVGQEYPITIDPTFIPDIPLGYGNVTSFTYNITPSMGAQTDYQIKFILSNASGISGYYAPDNIIYTNGTTRPDWYDVNATDGSNNPIPFWLENNTYTATNTTAWVKVPAINVGNTSVGKWYYGNVSQTESAISGLNTFPFWDDFIDGSLNTTKWTKDTSGSVTQSGGIITVSGESNAYNSGITGKTTFATENYTITSRTTAVYASGYDQVGWASEENGANPAYLIQARTESGGLRKLATMSAGALNTASWAWVIGGKQSIYRSGNTAYFVDSNGAVANTATSVPTVQLNASIVSTSIAGDYISVDWVFIRKSLTTDPTTSLYSTASTALTPPTASFTCTPTSTTLGTPITCTDASTNSPTNWTYYWGDGNVTDGTQNPSYTYPFTGTFSINQTVNNTIGSSWYNRSNYITITNVSGFTQQDLWQTGHYTITLNIKDSTNAPIPVVTVTDNNGQSYTTTNGTAFFTEDAGAVVFYFASTGYVSKAMSYIVDEDATHTVQLVTAGTNEPVYNVYPPKDVKFHITSFFGAPIQNANVTIQGITTSTGNWDWLVTLLGISLDEVAINGTAMTESTDTNGDVVFLMLPSVKYNITTTATGYTFPTTFIAPQAIEYTITANWNESWFSSGNDTLKDVNVSVSWVKKNDTYSFVNISYDDQTRTTTGGTINVYLDSAGRVANATSVATMDITGTTCSNSTLVNTPTGGASYRVLVNATTTDSNIIRTFTHYFKGAPVTLPGFDSESILWLALFIVIFTAAFAGAIHSPQMSIVLCVESWVFWAIGWLDALITQFWYGETAIIGILTLASFIALLWNITEGKSKVKRSS